MYQVLTRALALAALLAGLPSVSVLAAALDDIGRRLPPETPREPAAPPTLRVLPEAIPLAVANAPQSFVLTAVTIRGATVFRPQDFAALYEPYLTRTIGVPDVVKLAESITEKYRQAGYFLSRAVIPAQAAESGILLVDVIEGYIGEVRLEGADVRAVRERADALVGRRPLRLADLERTLSLIGDMNGIVVKQSRIEPDLADMSRHRLVLTLERDSVQGSLYVDNRGTQAAGRLQTYARTDFNSVLSDGDRFSVGLFTTPTSFEKLIYGEVSYTTVLSSGTTLTTSGGLTKSDASANLFGLQTEGEVQRVSLLLSHPFVRSRNFSLWGNLGLDARDLRGEQFGVTTYDERLRILTGSINLRQNAWNGTSTLYAEVSHGLSGLGASDPGATLLSRPDARTDFLKAELQLSRYQNIGTMFGLYVAANAQVSADALPASEEFALGGAQFGRAYDYWAVSGDHGVSTQVEFRHGKDPGFSLLKFYQLYGYYDIGWVWNRNAAPQFREVSLASAGVGLRLTLPGSLYLTYESAWPMSQTPYAPLDYSWRNYFSISASF